MPDAPRTTQCYCHTYASRPHVAAKRYHSSRVSTALPPPETPTRCKPYRACLVACLERQRGERRYTGFESRNCMVRGSTTAVIAIYAYHHKLQPTITTVSLMLLHQHHHSYNNVLDYLQYTRCAGGKLQVVVLPRLQTVRRGRQNNIHSPARGDGNEQQNTYSCCCLNLGRFRRFEAPRRRPYVSSNKPSDKPPSEQLEQEDTLVETTRGPNRLVSRKVSREHGSRSLSKHT